MMPHRWLDYQPPSNCCFDFGIGEALGASALLGGAEAAALPAEVAATGGLYAAGEAASAGILGTGIGLGDLGAAASVGGTLLSAKSGLDNAAYQSELAKSEAQALKQKANDDAASAERAQELQMRRSDLALSRARAVGAASGTDATSPDIINTEGQIAQQGNYNALTALYEGQNRARADNYQARIDLFNADRISQAAPLNAAGTILSGVSTFASNRARLKAYNLGGSAALL